MIIRLHIDNIPVNLNSFKNHAIYALIWTTTPWSLVANQAITFSANATYCLVENNSRDLYIIAQDLLSTVELKVGSLRTLVCFKGKFYF